MNREGHIGFSLLVVSSILYTFDLTDMDSTLIALLVVVFSVFPDLDLKWEIPHRKYTHNVMAGALLGFLIGTATYYGGLGFKIGFIGGFGGTLVHLFGDIFTYMPFKPLWPLWSGKVALHLFSSDNRVVNRVFMGLGVVTFTLYLILKVSGATISALFLVG